MLGIFAVILAVSMSAFTLVRETKTKPMFTNYYSFSGSDNADLNQTGDWESLGTEPPAQCGGANVVCIVTASQSTLAAFQSAITSANPHNETQLDAMSGVDIYSRKDP